MPRSLHVKHGAALFTFDIAGYFVAAPEDSFLTRAIDMAKESINQPSRLLLLFDTIIYIPCMKRYGDRMLHRVTRLNSAAKVTFGAELVVRAIF